MEYSEYEKKVMAEWPAVTDQDIAKLNDLFPHYIFFRRLNGGKDGVEFHASCCGHREKIQPMRRIELPWEAALLYGARHNAAHVCPWCGRSVTVKDLGKCGQRKNLREFREALLLHREGDVLYADALWLRKMYETEAELAGPLLYSVSSGYRFAEGEVMQLDHQHWGDTPVITYEGGSLGRRKMVAEPFKVGYIGYYGHEPYYIINQEVMDGHKFFGYSQFFGRWQHLPGGSRGYSKLFKDFVSYMTAYCIYPRQIEMLVKSGIWVPVSDLVHDRKKNTAAMCWEEPDIRKSMNVTKAELAQLQSGAIWLDDLAVRNYVAKHFGKQWPVDICHDFRRFWNDEKKVLQFLKRWNLDPDRFLRYVGAIYDEMGDGIQQVLYADIFQTYKDYIEAAYASGWCMEHSDVLWPRQLYTAHDRAVAAMAEKAPSAREGVAARGAERKLKYEFEADGLRVVFPLTAGAIRREGKELAHCVGGYAERHMKGVVTILFLRKSENPNVPYVTIEMDGNRIVQIHGYENDRGKTSPRVVHKAFLDKWLVWLAAGSKRNKDGTPKLPKTKKKASEVAA